MVQPAWAAYPAVFPITWNEEVISMPSAASPSRRPALRAITAGITSALLLLSGCTQQPDSSGEASTPLSTPASTPETSETASSGAENADTTWLVTEDFPEPEKSDYPGADEKGPARIVETRFPTEDVVVADIVVTDGAYGADNTGKEDCSAIIQTALNDCARAGGGTVYLPAGRYLMKSGVRIPAFVSLRGDWQDPDEGTAYGTVILADVTSTDSSLPALFQLGGSAGVNGLTVYYPRQSLDDIRPYPFTFSVNGQGDGYMLQTITNCTVINGYRGIGACVAEGNAHEMMTIDNVKGTFLAVGAEAYNQADVGTWKNLTISNKYWSEAAGGLVPADREALDAYTKANTTGLRLGDLEWTEFANIAISSCKTGVEIVKGKRIEFAGSFYDVSVTDCATGMQINSMDDRWGMVMARCLFEGSDYAVRNLSGGTVKATGVTLRGKQAGSIVIDTTDLEAYSLDYGRTPAKPQAKLFLVEGEKTGVEDVSEALQAQLDAAKAAGGGVVYLPAGLYRLNKPVTVPAGVELRGCSSVPTREQNGSSKGTLLLVYHGREPSDPDKAAAAVTLAGENAGVRGIRFLYPENGVLDGVKPYAYTVRGTASGVYAVNVAISGGYNGIDFRGCDNHFIKKYICCCYNNAMAVGGKNGRIEGCLQNGNMLYRDGFNFSGWPTIEGNIQAEVMNAVTRKDTVYIRLENAQGQEIFNTFAYGVKNFAATRNSTDVLIANVGADNIGSGCPLLQVTGGSVTAINVMRYNGISYENNGGTLKMYSRLTILDKNEPAVSE